MAAKKKAKKTIKKKSVGNVFKIASRDKTYLKAKMAARKAAKKASIAYKSAIKKAKK
tara:strand:- start:717 stop:887 length:171 start_codon:yes stop_codon:yes gene_type:complete